MKCEIAAWLLNTQEIIKKINLCISFVREVNKLTTIKIRIDTLFTGYLSLAADTMPPSTIYAGLVFVRMYVRVCVCRYFHLKLHFLVWWTQVGLYLLAISLYVHLQIPFIRASFMLPFFSVEETSGFIAFKPSQKKIFCQKWFNAEHCLIVLWNYYIKCCSTMLLILKVLN